MHNKTLAWRLNRLYHKYVVLTIFTVNKSAYLN